MSYRGEAAVSLEILHQEGFYPEESSGLFVGISTFEDERFAPVPFAVDDAIDLAWVFALELGLLDANRCTLALAGEPQKDVSRGRLEALLAAGVTLEQPRLAKVYQLATELSQSGSDRGLFVFAAATHGLFEKSRDYLVAADTRRDHLLKTGVEVEDLFDLATKAAAQRRLVMLDACRERLSQGTLAIADPAMSQSFGAAIAKATGLTVLSGSTVGGFAYDDRASKNGVFSGALVKGLLGAAQADSRGFITVATLANFVQEQVETWVRRHRREHLELSRGIEKRFDAAAENLPLSIDPRRARQEAADQERLGAALGNLHANIRFTSDAIIAPELAGEISRYLQESARTSATEELLAALENLDASDASQRVLRDIWRELRGPVTVPPPRRRTLIRPTVRPARKAKIESPLPASFPTLAPIYELPSISATARRAYEQPKTHEQHQAGELATDSFGLRFRWISGGSYDVGSPPEDRERFGNEAQQKVTIEGFWLAETAMTQTFWKQQGLKNPSKFCDCADCPVEQVSFFEAAVFANLLSERAGLEPCYSLRYTGTLGEESFNCSRAELKKTPCTGYRLPTEREWEVATRAQPPGAAYQARYGEIDAIAWYSGNSGGKTHPVGKKVPNHWGLFDMLGNVWEWTSSNFVYRGGSWDNTAGDVRAASRHAGGPVTREDFLGFRLSVGPEALAMTRRGRDEAM